MVQPPEDYPWPHPDMAPQDRDRAEASTDTDRWRGWDMCAGEGCLGLQGIYARLPRKQ